jgi:Arc/MetJ-type ribon-helix-helix transcriptional regulator
MGICRIRVTLDQRTVNTLDRLVREGRYPSRSAAIRKAIVEKLDGIRRTRLARECAKLDPTEEQQMAEGGFATDMAVWPAY